MRAGKSGFRAWVWGSGWVAGLGVAVFGITEAEAQNPAIEISVNGTRTPISPHIFGANDWCNVADLPITSSRLGGNRLTAYNWETNASNAGSDYIHNSDNYLVNGLSASDQKIPGILVENFLKKFKARKQYTLATVPAAGYVAADMNGSVSEAQVAPSSRWKKIVHEKPGGSLSLSPDINDGDVFTDEFLNFMVNKVGKSSAGGINAWSIDNEPGLWRHTHARVHPNVLNVSELLEKTVAAAKAVKKIDADAEIYGPATYGWGEMVNQDGGDWTTTYSKQYDWFMSAYLDMMKAESDKAGKRLLDVLDFHWYPEAQGDCRIMFVTTCNQESDAQAEARMQAPRSLWDSNYVEKSWIIDANGKKPIQLLNRVKKSIDQYYPGTKMAITEYEYGGHDHFSGGLAQADVLGVFSSEGLYSAQLWSTPGKFSRSGFLVYLNYDGQGGKYGDVAVPAKASDAAALSAFAALDSKDAAKLHIIAINKKAAAQSTQITVKGNQYTEGKVWGFDKASNGALAAKPAVSGITNNVFTYSLPPHSVSHFVLTGTVVGLAQRDPRKAHGRSLYRLQGRDLIFDTGDGKIGDAKVTARILGWNGREIRRMDMVPGEGAASMRALPMGQHILSLEKAGQVLEVSSLRIKE